MLTDRTGQTWVSGIVAVLLLVMAAAGLVDGLYALSMHQRCQEIASAAALRGSGQGRDYDYYLANGQISLDAVVSKDKAIQAADAAMAGLGLSGYTIQVEVLDVPGGGSVANFPPGKVWSESKPAVGVYIEAPINSVLVQAVFSMPFTIHVFAAAGVETQ